MKHLYSFITALLILGVFSAVANQFCEYLDMPVVKMTYIDKECVEVESPNNDITCDDITDDMKYQVVYVSTHYQPKG